MSITKRQQQGFNLIELIIIMAIVAIMAGIAAPSFNSMLDRRTVQAEANRLIRSINLARSNAVNNGMGLNATIEKTSPDNNDWSVGWRVFVDDDSNIATSYDSANDELVYVVEVDTRATSIISSGANRLMFNAQGRLVNGVTIYFSVCDDNHGSDIEGSLVTIRPTGSSTVEAIPTGSKATICVIPAAITP